MLAVFLTIEILLLLMMSFGVLFTGGGPNGLMVGSINPVGAFQAGPGSKDVTMVAGLGYLRFGTGSDAVSVPNGAKAGDVILERSTYATENGSYAADRGTLVVPENRADPNSRLIALPIVRIHAKSVHPAEPIFRLQGGPGITNMQFKSASRFADACPERTCRSCQGDLSVPGTEMRCPDSKLANLVRLTADNAYPMAATAPD